MEDLRLSNSAKQADLITHDDEFHADEVFATVILSRVFWGVTLRVCRVSEVPKNLREDAIVYDIGGGKFDHHQKGGNGCRENGVPYAACGLIWKEFGHELLEHVYYSSGLELSSELIEPVWNIIDAELIQGIDAIDNGTMPQADYPAQCLTISHLISGFNPNWDDRFPNYDSAFFKALRFAESIFDQILENAISKASAKSIVEEAIEKSEGSIMVFDQYVPWEDLIFASTNPKAAEIEFVIFPSNRGYSNCQYNCQCVPDAPGSFGQRKPLPEAWGGLRDKALQDVSGVETAIFCHPGRFICAAKTCEDAIRLAKLAAQA